MNRKTHRKDRRDRLSPAKQALLKKRLAGVEKNLTYKQSDKEGYPLSFAQERFWFLSELEPTSSAYNCSLTLRLRGALDLRALEQALSEIIQRHEVLRATFSTVNGEPAQQIKPALPISLRIVDLSKTSASEQSQKVNDFLAEEVGKPFELKKNVFRADLLRLNQKEHILLLVVHHIAFDAWSAGLFIQEMTTLYETACTGHLSSLPELPFQVADFAHWHKQYLQTDRFEKQLSYWKKKLAGIEPLNLPIDHARPAQLSYRAGQKSIILPVKLTDSLKALGNEEGATLFMTLMATFHCLLYRYSAQDNISVGTPIAGRTHVEAEELIGCFINTLVLRSDLSDNPTFRQLLAGVRQTTLEAFAHQELPFERLIKELQPERDLSSSPLFQVLFNFKSTRPATAQDQYVELLIDELETDSKISQFDLTLQINKKGEELSCTFMYSRDLFDESTIKRMAGHFQILLEGIVTNPETPISDLPLLTKAERHQLLVEWNDTAIDYPRDKCIHQLFEEQVEHTPSAIALIFDNEQLTYRQLNARANQLAEHLRTLGAGPDVLIGICVERSIEMIVGIFAILKAGGAYVPIDPHLPKERISFMLEDSKIKVLLTEQKWLSNLPHPQLTLVCLDSQTTVVSKKNRGNLINLGSSSDLAYVIYTSGSTGAPKGAMITHKNLCNHIHWSKINGLIKQSDRVLQRTTLSFDVASKEILVPLLTGATLVVASPDIQLDLNELNHLIIAYKITCLHLPPSALRLLAEDPKFVKKNCVRQIISGGEELDKNLRNRLLENSNFMLLNEYGPTETTIAASLHQCQLTDTGQNVSIGRPLDNTQIYLLDTFQQLVPAGHIGELCIAGDCVGAGYLNNPELTAEKFVSNPFGEGSLYKTGDLARYLPDGSIEYLGRKDYQVKIRGFRIELGEIENALTSLAEVREAVVMVREIEKGDRQLIAYVVGNTTDNLRASLTKKLPNYMVPSFYVQLDSLPLTSNGKIDRQALPELDMSKLISEESFVAPRSIVERQLADIWIELLNIERVGIHDNFFELGGHSLKAMQVVSRIRDTFQIELPLRHFFEIPTIAGLAQQIDTILWLIQPNVRTEETSALGEEGEI